MVLILVLMGSLWAQNIYEVDSTRSNAFYRADTSMLLVASDQIVGVSRGISGWFRGDLSSGEVVIKSDSFDSGNSTRDTHVQEILESNGTKNIIFIVGGISKTENGDTFLNGVLNVGGVSKNVNFPVSIKHSDGYMQIEGKKIVKYQDFGLEPPTVGGGIIKEAKEEILVGARIVGVKKGGQ